MSVLTSEVVNEARYLLYKLILKGCKNFAGKKNARTLLILIELM